MFPYYLRKIFYFASAIGFMAVILSLILPASYITPALPFLIIVFLLTSVGSFYFLLKSSDKRFIKFVNVFLLTILIKLLLYISIMITYALLNRADAVPFLLSFFILYLLFTVFETLFVIRFSQNSKKDSA
jgi:hypothetical protein